jgi:hypothetical protein
MEDQDRDEIGNEQAIALPKREAMSVIAPPLISNLTKAVSSSDSPPTDTGQGIDETKPPGE